MRSDGRSFVGGALVAFSLVSLAPALPVAGAEGGASKAPLGIGEDARRLDVEDPPERLFGLTIEEIALEAPPSEDKGALLALTGLSIGRPYVAAEIRRAVKLLYQLDRFDNVYVSAARAGNGVFLELVLPPRPRVREIKITGNEAFSVSEIEDAIGLRAGAELDPRALGQKREALAGALRRIGHRQPAIGVAFQRIDLNGNHDLLLRIDEGPRTRLRRVSITGRPARPDWLLRSRIGLRSGDVLDLTRVEAALEALESEYRRSGHLDVRIRPPEVVEIGERIEGDPAADLSIDIQAGPLVSVDFAGNAALSRRELDAAASIMTDIGAGPDALAEVKERIVSRYERRGFWQATVEPRVRVSPNGVEKNVVFAVREGDGSRIGAIKFVRKGADGVERSPEGGREGPRSDGRGRRIRRERKVSPLSEERLRGKVFEVVAEALSEDLGRPGADADTVGGLLGDRSLGVRGDRSSPDTTSPDPRAIYVADAYKAAADAIADLYRAEGYQSVEVDPPEVRARPAKGGRAQSGAEASSGARSQILDVTFVIREGVKWRLGALSFSGNESVDAQKMLELSKLDPARDGGEPLSFYKVYEASRAILAHYRNEGHLYARVRESLHEVSTRGSVSGSDLVTTSSAAPANVERICRAAAIEGRPTCDVELVFRVIEGPLVRTRNIVIRGVETTKESLVRSELAVEEGEILRESDMLSTRANLLRVGVFERVTVRPIDEKNAAAEKDVVCEVRERKHSSFEVGAGASTEEGVRMFAGYGHSNLLGTALRFHANAKVNYQPFLLLYDDSTRPKIEQFYSGFTALQRIEREIAIGFSYPRIFGLPRGFGSGLDVSHVRDNAPAFAEDTFTVTLTGNYTGFRPVLAERQRPLTFQLRTNFDLSILLCNPEIGDSRALCSSTSRRVKGTSIYASVGPSVRWDLLDDPLDPHQGAYVELSSDLAKGLDASSPDFVNVQGKLNLYLPLTGGMGLAFSLLAGRIFPLEDGTIPVNRKYFAGGRSTVRGYPEQSLFPKDDARSQAERLISSGGLFFVALKNELRFPLSGALSVALFYDIGDLFDDPKNFTLAGIRQGAGAGIRFATPVGPLSLDFAVPLEKRGDPGEVDWTVHFAVRSF